MAVVVAIRSFIVQPFLVSGASMEPNFSSNDYLLIDEVSYRFNEPERGDVIVFHYPGDESVYYIKRVIGLPGERLLISDGKVKIYNSKNSNGFILEEFYLPAGLKTSGNEEVTLKDGQYFVMGDNRNYSFDSRSWGSLQKSEIVGLVRLRLWPFNKAMAVEQPAY